MSKVLTVAAMALALCAASCKTRDPDAGGLLTESTSPEPETGLTLADGTVIPDGGNWTVTCKPLEGDGDPSTYVFAVKGAVSPTDDSQNVLISVTRQRRSERIVAASSQAGHGALSLAGPLFVGFPGGLLTADPVTPKTEAHGSTHVGILTLAVEKAIEGLKVGCTAAAQP